MQFYIINRSSYVIGYYFGRIFPEQSLRVAVSEVTIYFQLNQMSLNDMQTDANFTGCYLKLFDAFHLLHAAFWCRVIVRCELMNI